MFRYLTLLYFFCAWNTNAQMLDNTEGKTFGDVPFFNENFIQRNKVKAIKGYYSTKAPLDYIRKTKDVFYYEFNEAGQLVKDYRTQYGDTLVSMYTYNDKGLIEVLRKSDNGGFYSYHFIYDDKGRVLTKEYRRDINKKGSKANFKLDKTFFVSTETFSYVDLEGLDYKKIYFNNVGKVYKEEFFTYNEFENLSKQEGRLKMGSGLTSIVYSFDNRGRVREKVETKRVMGSSIAKWTYEYDAHSNILAQHYYKKGTYLSEKQIVYSEKTMLLDAIITRDPATDNVTILEFKDYTFF